MNILLLGSGGREHALAWKIAASPLLTKLWCAPGNAGTTPATTSWKNATADHLAVINFCQRNAVDFVVVGPGRSPSDTTPVPRRAAPRRAFGPTQAAGRLE